MEVLKFSWIPLGTKRVKTWSSQIPESILFPFNLTSVFIKRQKKYYHESNAIHLMQCTQKQL